MAFDPDAYLAAKTAPGGFDPEEYLKKKAAPGPLEDPYSTASTLGRIGTSAAAGPVDLAGGAINAVAGLAEKAGMAKPEPVTLSTPYSWSWLGSKLGLVKPEDVTPDTRTFTGQVPSLAAGLRSVAGVPELPQDASTPRRLFEGAATGLATGGRSLVNAVQSAPTALQAAGNVAKTVGRTAVAPAVGSEVGGTIGEAVGGPEGRFAGSLLGGYAGAGGVKPLIVGGVERYYGAHARPGAADIAAKAKAEDIPLTAGMLGNERIQNLERDIANRSVLPGLDNPVMAARERTLVATRERADQAAAARGSTDPMPTPGSIGENIVDTAKQTGDALHARSSAGQQALVDRTGPTAPVNVANTYAALRAEMQKTSPDSGGRPLQARLDALEQMMPRDYRSGRVIVGPNGEINVPYERIKDWRSNLGRNTQTQEAVPAGHLDQIYGPITDAMRETAAAHGVSPAEFNTVQNVTRTLTGSGGPTRYFEGIAGQEGTSGGKVGGKTPEAAFTHVIKRGEQNPERLVPFEQHAPGELNRIAGDTLRLRTQETLGQGGTGGSGAPIEGTKGGGARGAANFANWWNSLSAEAKRILGGNQQGTMQNLAELMGAFNYPTRQTGLGRAVGGVAGGLGGRFAVANALGEGAHALGIPKSVGWGAGYFGAAPALNYGHGRMLESQAALRGMAGQRSSLMPNIEDLRAALIAANTARPQQ